MTRDPKKLDEYRKRYQEKLKRLNVTTLGMRTFFTRLKCHKCVIGFAPRDEMYRKKGRVIKYYHQKCWDEMQY